LICVKEQFDTSTPMGRAMMNMTAAFAQMERETIAERVRDNMMFLSKTGRWLGGPPPTGFSLGKEEEIIMDGKVKKASRLTLNEDMKIIKLVFEKFLEIGSLNAIAKYLTRSGIKSINGNYYKNSVIKQILSNPVYCDADKGSFVYFKQKGSNVCFDKKDCNKGLGIMPFNRHSHGIIPKSEWIIALGKHKGIISGKEWVETQNIIEKNKSLPYTYVKYSLLSGKIDCGHCGNPMFSKLYSKSCRGRGSDIKFSYYCYNKLKYGIGICNCKNLVGKKTDDKVVEYLTNYDENDLRKGLDIKHFVSNANKFKDKSEEIHFQIMELKHQQDKYVEHLLTLDKRSPLLKKVESKVQYLENQIEKLQNQKHIYDNQSELSFDEKTKIEQTIKNLSLFKQNFHSLEFDEKKSLLRLILKKITWNGSKLDIILSGEQR
jgi:site-specific DNA recombinase